MSETTNTKKVGGGNDYVARLSSYVRDRMMSDGAYTFEDIERVGEYIEMFRDAEREKRKSGGGGFINPNETPDVLYFGKYKTKTVKDVAAFDRKYLGWVVKQSWLNEKTAEAIRTELEAGK